MNGLAFTRDNYGTSSSTTGPSSGAANSVWYMYAETSFPNYPNKMFDMQKNYPVAEELYGVTFQYHKYGAAIGSALLECSGDGTSWNSLWSKSGNLGNQWLQATVYAGSGQTMLRYTYACVTNSSGACTPAMRPFIVISPCPHFPLHQVHVSIKQHW